jgi:hypothetical protein
MGYFSSSRLKILLNMAYILYRRLLAGLALGFCGVITPAIAQTSHRAASSAAEHVVLPAPDAAASVKQFVALCETKLQLASEQTTALHTYLDQEINYLRLAAFRPSAPAVSDLVPTEGEQFSQVMVRLLSPGQLRQYHQLQAYLHSMALLPDAPALAKQNKKKTNEMLAQRLEAEE